MRIILPPDHAERRKKRAVEQWERLRRTIDRGEPHPANREIAELVRHDGTPTQWSLGYVADRVEGKHRIPGRPRQPDAAHWKRLLRALRLHEAIELRAAAFRLQRIRGPKTRAQECVHRTAGRGVGELKDWLRRQISEPLKNGSGGWRTTPLTGAEDAEQRLREAIGAGVIVLDPEKGWRAVKKGARNPGG